MAKACMILAMICLLALIIELDFFIALPKFGAEHFGAPDDIKELVKYMPDRPAAVVAIGIIILFGSFAGIAAAFIWIVMDTYRNYPGIGMTFLRFLIILEGYKLFDVICFDWLLLTKIRLPEKLAPETKGAKGYDSFGFNAKSQMMKAVLFAVLSLAAAIVFSFICR